MKTVFINAKILDGNLNDKGEMPVKEGAVEIDGDKIVGIYGKDKTFGSDYNVVDLNGKYLLPGLINLHVHLAASGKPPKANAKPVNYKKLFDTLTKIPFVMKVFAKLEEGLAKNYLLSGTTTIRTVGGVLDIDGKIRDKIKKGKLNGPRIYSCNTAVSVPGGHFAGSLATEAETVEMAVSDVEKIANTNPDWIKLMVTGGVMDASKEGEPGVLRMKPEMVKACCDKAHELGYKVAAHVESTEGVKVALRGGVDTIEHGASLDDEAIELFKKTGSVDVCTISPTLPYALFDKDISHVDELGKKNGYIVMNGIIDCAKKCLESGIKVGLGTDAGCAFITSYDTWRELYYFVKYLGVSPAFTLHTATKINAEILGKDDEIGSIEVGKIADMIVCENNPLDTFTNLRKLDKVIFNGKIISNLKIKKREDVENALDGIL